MKRIGILLLALLCLLLCACDAEPPEEAAYVQAQTLLQEGEFAKAAEIFASLGNYKDSQYLLQEAELAREYTAAVALLEEKDYAGAYTALSELGNYKDVPQLLEPFQKILLTEENWDTYYELCDELDWSGAEKAETGGYNGLLMHYMFLLKEEYLNCIYQPEKNTLMTGLKASYQRKELELNEETGIYALVERGDPGYTKKTEVQGLENGCRALISTERVVRSLDDEENFVCYISDSWTNWDITSFSGELYLYQE